MDIAFYAPFKSLDHPDPSGDQSTAAGIVWFLSSRGHSIRAASDLRTRWIFLDPRKWPGAAAAFVNVLRTIRLKKPDLWLTYHTYYKAPDIIGPWISRLSGVPYVIFQGMYSTKPKRRLKTLPGFYLNRWALEKAVCVMVNRKEDLKNLKRLLPDSRLYFCRPGIIPEDFTRNEAMGNALRRTWGSGTRPVILTAAMFRDDVKTRGLSWLIRCCGRLKQDGIDFFLVIAGDGPKREELYQLADRHIPGHFRFAGKLSRSDMPGFYSSGDFFAFPGIRESLGMVFLEAQSCGLPVVAFHNGGIPEVVDHQKTGFLTPLFDVFAFENALKRLLADVDLRTRMGRNAQTYVRSSHDLNKNYQVLEKCLQGVLF